jgi:hypothetical protein
MAVDGRTQSDRCTKKPWPESLVRALFWLFRLDIDLVPPAGFEPAPPPPEGGALSPELRGLKVGPTKSNRSYAKALAGMPPGLVG